MSKVKILFMGTPKFGVIILETLCQSEFKPILVVTAPDKPVGRKQILTPPPVKLLAEKYKIPVLQTGKILNLKSEILNLTPDLIVVAACGQILPKEILDIPKYGCLNIHPSLLPKYRGPSPIQAAILNGDKETGVSIILMQEKIDSGPTISKSKIKDQKSKITYEELHAQLAKLGAELLIETIPKWIKGKIKPKPQDDSKASYTKILKREDGRIDWRKTAEELERQIRAFDSWPGSYVFWQVLENTMLRVKILKARVYQSPPLHNKTYPIGKILVVPQNEIGVQCGKDFLVLEKLKMEGGKEMTSEEFLRGHPDFIMTTLR